MVGSSVQIRYQIQYNKINLESQGREAGLPRRPFGTPRNDTSCDRFVRCHCEEDAVRRGNPVSSDALPDLANTISWRHHLLMFFQVDLISQHQRMLTASPKGKPFGDEGDDENEPKSLPLWGRWPAAGGSDEVDMQQWNVNDVALSLGRREKATKKPVSNQM